MTAIQDLTVAPPRLGARATASATPATKPPPTASSARAPKHRSGGLGLYPTPSQQQEHNDHSQDHDDRSDSDVHGWPPLVGRCCGSIPTHHSRPSAGTRPNAVVAVGRAVEISHLPLTPSRSSVPRHHRGTVRRLGRKLRWAAGEGLDGTPFPREPRWLDPDTGRADALLKPPGLVGLASRPWRGDGQLAEGRPRGQPSQGGW